MVCVSIWPQLTVYNNVSIWWCVYQFDLSWLFLYDGEMTKITISNQSRKSKRKYKSENERTRTSEYIRGGIRCHGGVSIPCWPVTPAVSPIGCVYQFDLSWLFVYDGVYINLTSVDCVQQCFYMMVCISIWP
jgi:hypothetical protein